MSAAAACLSQLHLFQVGDLVWAECCCLLKEFQALLDEACSTDTR